MQDHELSANPDLAQQQTQALMQRLAEGARPYKTGKFGQGTGQHVLLLGGTGYVGQALVSELLERNYQPVLLSRSQNTNKVDQRAHIVIGDITDINDVRKACEQYPIEAVITLVSGRRPNDAQECYQIDYVAVTNAIKVVADKGIEQFIQISDYGVYHPHLLPQKYKLQVEGELLGDHYGHLNYTIVRPTAYYPYLAIHFETVRHGGKYRMFDHGEYACCNPIAREDLAEFITNQLFNKEAYGRILPVGGPVSRDNMCTIKTAGDMMFEVLDKQPQFDPQSLAAFERKIRLFKFLGYLIPTMKKVAFYLEAARYWSIIPHMAPPYGKRTLKEFMGKMKARETKPSTFRQRMKSGTDMIPTDV